MRRHTFHTVPFAMKASREAPHLKAVKGKTVANALKQTVVTLLVAAGITLGTAGAAVAATSYVGGGTWWHGLTAGTVYSDYFHSTRCHGSTAVGSYTIRSASMLPGYLAQASAPRATHNNETYWRHCG